MAENTPEKHAGKFLVKHQEKIIRCTAKDIHQKCDVKSVLRFDDLVYTNKEMKKNFPLFVWHKRSGRMLSSKVLQTRESPRGAEKKKNLPERTPAEQFLKKLQTQIRKTFILFLFYFLCSSYLLSAQGCSKKEKVKPPLGKWKREATYINGKFSHERRATLTLKKTLFILEESTCETRGIVSYQSRAMIWHVQETDCYGVSIHDEIDYGYTIDPGDGSLKIFRNNFFYDEIRDVYRRIR